MRSRRISVSIIIQNMAQLKGLFKDSWESVVGNCDTFLYLGGNEQSTHEYISKMLGKETIGTQTRGITKGRNGSSNTNYQNAGREDGGAMPYTHSKDDKYLIEDLSVSDIENLEFIELEDADNEKNSEHEQN